MGDHRYEDSPEGRTCKGGQLSQLAAPPSKWATSLRTTPCTSLRMAEFPWLESPLAMLVTWRKPCTTSPSNYFLAPVESRSSPPPHTLFRPCVQTSIKFIKFPLLSRSKYFLCLSKSDETPGDFNAMTFPWQFCCASIQQNVFLMSRAS